MIACKFPKYNSHANIIYGIVCYEKLLYNKNNWHKLNGIIHNILPLSCKFCYAWKQVNNAINIVAKW